MGATAGRSHVSCLPAKFLIRTAYVNSAEDRNRLIYEIGPATRFAPVSGGPAWMSADRLHIEAKAEGNPSGRMMHGAMLQPLLEDRSKLKLHRETKEIPVRELIVAKGGFNCRALRRLIYPLSRRFAAP
jgi:hypothetical protein